jgi:hypothetical protein
LIARFGSPPAMALHPRSTYVELPMWSETTERPPPRDAVAGFSPASDL